MEVYKLITKVIQKLRKDRTTPLRVGVNGIEGTGKTMFTKALTNVLISQSLPAMHISIDGFHHDKKQRYKQGKDSSIGYYEDAYDEPAFLEKVLLASQKAEPKITSATHDLITDKYLDLSPISISSETIIITDGAYIFKDLFSRHWDLKIYLKANYSAAMERGAERDKSALGSKEIAIKKFEERYHKASKMYIESCNPEDQSHIVIDYNDFTNPMVIKNNFKQTN